MTRYEIALTMPDGTRYLIAYTPRHSRRGVEASCAGRVGPRIAAFLGLAPDAEWQWDGKGFFRDGCTIGFTGRTQRQAKQEGELPRIPGSAA